MILEYLFYKIQIITRFMDTSMYLDIHAPTIISSIFFAYLIDIILIVKYVIKESFLWNTLYVWGMLFVYFILWISLYSYFRYKHRYLQVMRNKKFELSSSLWAYFFIFTPFVIMGVMALFL